MITIEYFGSLEAQPIYKFTLRNQTGMTATVLSLGAIIQSLFVPDKNGKPTDVCLGFGTSDEYLKHDYFMGACVGRCANRIADGTFSLNEQIFSLSKNEDHACLHGGPEGFHRQIWDFAVEDDRLTLSLFSPHLDQGFPGNLKVKAIYQLFDNGRLSLDYFAQCDRDTVVNLSNHAYFNLSGSGGGHILSHSLQLNAHFYTPCDEHNLPTGEIRSVTSTPLNFTEMKEVGADLSHAALAPCRGYDHNYVLDGSGMKTAAKLKSWATGINLEMKTTAPGLQLYTGNFLPPLTGKNGASYGPYHGLCLEPQHFPNAINTPGFPSPVVKAGEQYHHGIEFVFGCGKF